MDAPTILFYNLDSERGRRIRMLCLPLKIRPRSISPAEYGLTLRELLEGAAPGKAPLGETFADEMLVMANLTGAQMNGFLQGFRRKKLSPVALKAVLTPTNGEWDSFRLRAELSAEHEAMKRGETAHEEISGH